MFDLAKYANLTEEERKMYNASLKRKWDNKNVMDYAVESAAQKARDEERAKAENEKKEMARNLRKKAIDLEVITEVTGFSIDELEAL